ncbi:DUF6178 family protein [Desulfatiglans anilini]|uniref:DUF6178 family protein n=1 Tax=Desulfatiglans anilini TaxID=90728 RepID=UPI00040D6849|nr:DUF6178 family protein [Desulfatiglans anilini]
MGSDDMKTVLPADRPPRGGADLLALERDKGGLLPLQVLSGSELINRVLAMDSPEAYVQDLSSEDLYWLVKKVGADDAGPLLQLASEDQWQYILDLELWRKDSLELEAADRWLARLQQADLRRLTRWLVSEEGQSLGYLYFFRRLEVLVKSSDEDLEIPDGFFTLDGIFYLRVPWEEARQAVTAILHTLAANDFQKLQALLATLGGVIPAELEEGMYRLRNVRLAEHGFLPYEEALAIYAPLDPRFLARPDDAEAPALGLPDWVLEEEPLPVAPLYHGGVKGPLAEALSHADDPVFLERMQMEFAGLCNQIVVADRMTSFELEDLIRVSRKGAGYINIALERAASGDLERARSLIERNTLAALFRAGFGEVLSLRWEAERWTKESWFAGEGLQPGFWGEVWGGTLSAVLEPRPRFFAGIGATEHVRDFHCLEEVESARRSLGLLKVLDRLLGSISEGCGLDRRLLRAEAAAFEPILFNPFAYVCLGLEPSLEPLPVEQARAWLKRLGGSAPMAAFEDLFIATMTGYAAGFSEADLQTLETALRTLWHEFEEEYGQVSPETLSSRYAPFIWIESAP